jgi:methanogenic corrinoid protein MtbC1
MNIFGNQVKKIRKERGLRQKDLAEILKVAQSTIANYEQGIRFPDEAMLRRLADIFGVTVDYLLGRSPDAATDSGNTDFHAQASQVLDPLVEQFIDYVLELNTTEAEKIINQMLLKKTDIIHVYIHILQPALYEIGRRWEIGEIDVSEEHYFSEVVQDIMARAMSRVNGMREGLVFVGFSVSGEFHDIGIRMVSDVLAIHGWNSIYLGNNLPASSVLKAIRDSKADAVGISVTMPYHVNAAAGLIRVIRNSNLQKPVRIVVGGRVFNHDSELWKRIGADAYAKDAEHLVAVLSEEGAYVSQS